MKFEFFYLFINKFNIIFLYFNKIYFNYVYFIYLTILDFFYIYIIKYIVLLFNNINYKTSPYSDFYWYLFLMKNFLYDKTLILNYKISKLSNNKIII